MKKGLNPRKIAGNANFLKATHEQLQDSGLTWEPKGRNRPRLRAKDSGDTTLQKPRPNAGEGACAPDPRGILILYSHPFRWPGSVGQFDLLRRARMFLLSRTFFAAPFRATTIIARPSSSVVRMELGKAMRRNGSSGRVTA